jgi:hypothetical protein
MIRNLLIFSIFSLNQLFAADEETGLFVSQESPGNDQMYMLTYWQNGQNGWQSYLIQIDRDYQISLIRESDPSADRNSATFFTNYVKKNEKEFFFSRTLERNNGLDKSLCELNKEREFTNCFSDPWLDTHDFLINDIGNRIYMFHMPRKLRIEDSTEPDSLDLVLKEYDELGHIVWEWSSDKFFNHRDRIKIINDQSPLNDYIHANSLEWDGNDGIIVSARNLDLIFKIAYPTGEIVWKLGGYGAKSSDFRIINDPLRGFSRQHSARKLSNGNILLFDNGNGRPNGQTRAVEYELDFENWEANLVWEYRAQSPYLTRSCCGAVQRLNDGNTLISWGSWESSSRQSKDLPVAVEVNRKGETQFELRSKNFGWSWRMTKLQD